jgi:hypothetical protein
VFVLSLLLLSLLGQLYLTLSSSVMPYPFYCFSFMNTLPRLTSTYLTFRILNRSTLRTNLSTDIPLYPFPPTLSLSLSPSPFIHLSCCYYSRAYLVVCLSSSHFMFLSTIDSTSPFHHHALYQYESLLRYLCFPG